MRGSAGVTLPPPQPRATPQKREPLIALIVVGVSFGLGYVASRVWPLSIRSAPPASAEMTATKDALSPQPRLPAARPSPAALQPLAATPNVSQAAPFAVQPTGSSGTSYSAPVALEAPSRATNRTVEDEASAPAGPRIVRSPHLSPRQARRTPVAGPPEFAPNPRPNQPPGISWPFVRETEVL